ncbi:MAG: hypothetical protein [Caudoviricetes sp.]|nr:MAG: hypothetical protein [Caudoviricetes sp.]
MKYLPPNGSYIINIPVIVGGEYTIPTGKGTLTTRTSDGNSTKEVALVESSTLEISLDTPDVAPGKLKVMSIMLVMPTPLGQLKYRENFGIIDLLDIPTTGDDVRNLFGLNASELIDEEMDIEGKYLNLYPLLINSFHASRQTNEYLNKLFGDLIAVVEAIALAPSLIIRIDKQRSTENGDVKRFGDASNLDGLIDYLTGKRAELLEALDDYIEDETLTQVSLLTFVPLYNFATGGTT